MSRLIAADTLVSSMLTIRRDWVPGMRAKFTMRREPSAATKPTDPLSLSELIALSAIEASSGIESSARPIMLASSAGAASTVPVLSTSTAEIPGRPPRLPMIFDIQFRLMPATIAESESSRIAATG